MNAHQLRIKDIVDRYKNFIFLSPHYDDAVLSCGYLLEKLHSCRKNISVITIFTQPSERPYSPQALTFLRTSGYKSAERLFCDRQKEDISALHIFGGKHLHLSCVDAAWRKSELYQHLRRVRWLWKLFPQLAHVYPNPKKQFSGSWSRKDSALFRELAMKLQNVIFNQYDKKTVVFVPLGIGGHADHILVRDVAKTLSTPVFYWEDFPYNTSRYSYSIFFSKNNNYEVAFEIQPTKRAKKYQAIRRYRSQVAVLFPDGKIPLIAERYFSAKDSMRR